MQMRNSRFEQCLLMIGLVALAATRSLSGQAPAGQPPASCDAIGDVQFVCGQNGPEDLVVVPGSQWVVASSYGGRGGIMLIRVSDRMSSVAYLGTATTEKIDAENYTTCPGQHDNTFKAKSIT